MSNSKGSEIGDLDSKLWDCVETLKECEQLIMTIGLAPDRNIWRIGEALRAIFEIQQDIYDRRPDLKPDRLKD